MKRLLFLGLPAMLLSFSAAKPPTYNHFNLAKLSDGVWAALHKSPGGHAICNAGIVDMGDKTLVIDPFMNLDAAEELKGAAIQLTGREPSIVINTHFHNDHIRGNQLFPGAMIISTVWARAEMARMEPLELKWEKENAPAILAAYQRQASSAQGLLKKELPLWIDYFEGMIKSALLLKTTLPTVTFNDSLWLYGTKRHIKLVEYDNGHTKSDAAVMLPEEKIVFTGDLLFNQAHPWLSDGNPTQWKTYLDQWKSDPSLSTFIPGHGEPGDRKSVEAMSNYIKDLQELVARQKMKGTPDSVIIQSTIPAPYADWMFGSRFFEANLSFLCRKK